MICSGRPILISSREERWLCAPMLVWYMPVITAERLGEQTGAVMKALVKRAPSRARRSMFGVSMVVSP